MASASWYKENPEAAVMQVSERDEKIHRLEQQVLSLQELIDEIDCSYRGDYPREIANLISKMRESIAANNPCPKCSDTKEPWYTSTVNYEEGHYMRHWCCDACDHEWEQGG